MLHQSAGSFKISSSAKGQEGGLLDVKARIAVHQSSMRRRVSQGRDDLGLSASRMRHSETSRVEPFFKMSPSHLNFSKRSELMAERECNYTLSSQLLASKEQNHRYSSHLQELLQARDRLQQQNRQLRNLVQQSAGQVVRLQGIEQALKSCKKKVGALQQQCLNLKQQALKSKLGRERIQQQFSAYRSKTDQPAQINQLYKQSYEQCRNCVQIAESACDKLRAQCQQLERDKTTLMIKLNEAQSLVGQRDQADAWQEKGPFQMMKSGKTFRQLLTELTAQNQILALKASNAQSELAQMKKQARSTSQANQLKQKIEKLQNEKKQLMAQLKERGTQELLIRPRAPFEHQRTLTEPDQTHSVRQLQRSSVAFSKRSSMEQSLQSKQKLNVNLSKITSHAAGEESARSAFSGSHSPQQIESILQKNDQLQAQLRHKQASLNLQTQARMRIKELVSSLTNKITGKSKEDTYYLLKLKDIESKIDEQGLKVEEGKHTAADLLGEIKALKEQNRRLKQQASLYKAPEPVDQTPLEAQLRSLKQIRTALQSKIASLKQQLLAQSQLISTLKDQLRQAQQTLQSRNSALNKLKLQNKEKELKVVELRNELAEADRNMQKQRKESQGRINSLNDSYQTLQKKIATVGTRLQKSQCQVRQLRQANKKLQQQKGRMVASHEKETAGLVQQLLNQKKKVVGLHETSQQILTQLQAANSSLKQNQLVSVQSKDAIIALLTKLGEAGLANNVNSNLGIKQLLTEIRNIGDQVIQRCTVLTQQAQSASTSKYQTQNKLAQILCESQALHEQNVKMGQMLRQARMKQARLANQLSMAKQQLNLARLRTASGQQHSVNLAKANAKLMDQTRQLVNNLNAMRQADRRRQSQIQQLRERGRLSELQFQSLRKELEIAKSNAAQGQTSQGQRRQEVRKVLQQCDALAEQLRLTTKNLKQQDQLSAQLTYQINNQKQQRQKLRNQLQTCRDQLQAGRVQAGRQRQYSKQLQQQVDDLQKICQRNQQRWQRMQPNK